jgi:hypothetical protein
MLQLPQQRVLFQDALFEIAPFLAAARVGLG